eukprot:1150437-Pelagomonas_calceolata.AAC.3
MLTNYTQQYILYQIYEYSSDPTTVKPLSITYLVCRYEGLCALRQKYSELLFTGYSSPAHPFLQHQLSVQTVSNFLSQRKKKLFYFMSELLELLLASMDQPQADQLNSLAEGPPVQPNLIYLVLFHQTPDCNRH